MGKRKVRKGAATGSGRTASAPGRISKRYIYPKAELDELFTSTGNATIQGVHFDLRPAELINNGFVPSLFQYGVDPFLEAGLTMPWDGPSSVVRADDTVTVSMETLNFGHQFDHESDQNIVLVEFVVFRKGKKLNFDVSPLDFARSDTSLWLFDSRLAFERLAKLSAPSNPPVCRIGDLTTDPSSYGGGNQQQASDLANGPQNTRTKALTAAFGANYLWSEIVRTGRTLSVKSNEEQVDKLLTRVGKAIDDAVSLGYWLAKLEIEPQIPIAITSMARTKKVAEKLRDKADARWRKRGLELALAERSADPSISQNKLAEKLHRRLQALKCHPPSIASIKETIVDWEKKLLPRSTRNPTR